MALHTILAPSAPTKSPDGSYRKLRSHHSAAHTLAIVAGVVLFAASAGTNAIYGWHKADFLPQQVTWAAVSVAASLILALAPSAFLQALRLRSLAGSLLALVALLLCGSYSFTAAIGASAGSRMASQAAQTSDDGTRGRLERSYAAVTAELASLPVARPSTELTAKIASLKQTRGANECTKVDGPISSKVCNEVASLEVDLARALKREELQAKADEASEALTRNGPARVANTDSAALSAYLGVAGISISVDALNRWLALLAVALIEFGPGLSFTLAHVLAMEHQRPARSLSEALPGAGTVARLEHMEQTPVPTDATNAGFVELTEPDVGGTSPVPKLVVSDDLQSRMVELVKSHGTEVMGSHRTFAMALGCSHTQAARVLAELEAAGVVALTKGRGGTVVRLANAA